MICIHNRLLTSTCIDCDPLAFFDRKLTAALEADPAAIEAEVRSLSQSARAAMARRTADEDMGDA